MAATHHVAQKGLLGVVMATSQFPELLWLGTGGNGPAVRAIACEGNPEASGSSREVEASVYALDVDPLAGRIAWGTRAGAIYRYQVGTSPDAANESPESAHFFAGSAITSLCFTADGGLIGADDAGRILRWRAEAQDVDQPGKWEADCHGICQVGATATHLAALGSNGGILVWREGGIDPVAHLMGPPPMRPLSLARITTWACEGRSVVVYPAEGGQLVVVQTDPPSVRVAPAHHGGWYAAFQIADSLATMGHDDGRIRFWRLTGEVPVCCRVQHAIHGVIDAEMFPAAPSQGAVVLSNGRAIRFSLEGDSFELRDAIDGDGYRIVTGPSARFRGPLDLRRRQERAEELEHRIINSLERADDEDLSEAFRELDALDCGAISLALRAHQAHLKGDVLAELDARHRLDILLPRDSPDALPLCERYRALLLEVGQYELALELANRMVKLDANRKVGLQARWLADGIEAMRSGQPVVFSGASAAERMEMKLAASGIVGRPLKGLWELRRSGPILVPDVWLQPADILAVISTIVGQETRPPIGAVSARVLWIEDGVAEAVEAVLLPSPALADCPVLKILLRPALCSAGTELTRWILFDPCQVEKGAPDGLDLSELLRTARLAKEQGGRATVLAPLNRVIYQTLQRLRTMAATSRANFSGNAE